MSGAPHQKQGAPPSRVLRLVDQFGHDVHLSGRQVEMLKLAVSGVHRKEVAARLGCSLKTVEGYWKRIFEKAGCSSDAEVVARFIRLAVLKRGHMVSRPAPDHHDHPAKERHRNHHT